MVKKPLILTMEELKRFPSVSRLYFLECSGNSFSEWTKPKEPRVQEAHGLTSCSEWTGVLLSVLLQEVEVEPHASWIVAEGADGAAMTRSLPLEKCVDDVIVAYGQNGEALQPAQGYPLRLLVPGWEGNISVKWLRRLKVVDQPYQTREETSKYTDLMPDGAARQFTFVMDAKSVITFPSGGQRLTEPGFYEIRGLAWSGRGRVQRVEVSADNGLSWREAKLQQPVLSKCHTRFHLPWRWDGKDTIIQSRCVDETGYVQPTREALLKLRGTQSIYHYNAIQRWRIAADGRVFNA
jgi:sulfane dehydrogenase subunit SoxC